jgi:uncharacterized membrane protein YjjP (DUF1212 family)
MLIPLPELDLMPRPVRRAVILTFLGWVCFLVATYAFYDPNSFFKFAIAGGIICYYLYKSKRWARVIAMLASVFIVFYGGFFTVLFAGRDMVAMALSAANVALFAAAFVYLLLPEANRYFKQMATTAESPDDRSSRSDTQGDG